MERKIPLNRWFSVILESMRSEINKEMLVDGVDSGEFSILMYLFMYGDGINQRQLTDLLVIDRAAISRSIQRLITKGYISKQKDVLDQRAFIIYLTDEGHKLEPRLNEVYDNVFHKLAANLSPEDLEKGMESLIKVYENAVKMKQP